MRRSGIWYIILCGLAIALTGCAGSTQGPSTWIDRPLDGDRIAQERLTLLAHASNTSGIDHFEFYANDTGLGNVSGEGQQFAEASVDWLPASPGSYAIRVRAVDNAGNSGPEAIAKVIVDGAPASPTASLAAPVITPSPTVSLPFVQPTATAAATSGPLVRPTQSPTPAPLSTATPFAVVPPVSPSPTPAPLSTATPPAVVPPVSPSPAPMQPSDIRFWADADTLAAGSCTTVRWHVANVSAYWIDGNAGAGDEGSFQTCPCNDETHTLHVRQVGGAEQDRSVTIHVQGQCVTPISGNTSPGDTLGPTIDNVRLEASGTSDTGCRAAIRVRVTDPSGVAWVRLHYSLNGDAWNTIDLSPQGGDDYGALIPGASGGAGNIEFSVEGADTPGNTSQTGNTRQDLPFCGPG